MSLSSAPRPPGGGEELEVFEVGTVRSVGTGLVVWPAAGG